MRDARFTRLINRFAEIYDIEESSAETVLLEIYYAIRFFLSNATYKRTPMKRTAMYIYQAYDIKISRHSLRRWYNLVKLVKQPPSATA